MRRKFLAFQTCALRRCGRGRELEKGRACNGGSILAGYWAPHRPLRSVSGRHCCHSPCRPAQRLPATAAFRGVFRHDRNLPVADARPADRQPRCAGPSHQLRGSSQIARTPPREHATNVAEIKGACACSEECWGRRWPYSQRLAAVLLWSKTVWR